MNVPNASLVYLESLLFLGAHVLTHLDTPLSPSALLVRVQADCLARGEGTPVTFARLVLTLDLLYALGAIDLVGGQLRRGEGSHLEGQTTASDCCAFAELPLASAGQV